MIRWTVVMLLFAHGWVHMVLWGLLGVVAFGWPTMGTFGG